MGKKKDIDVLTTLLSLALAHRIGSVVNKNDIYAQKYAHEGERFFKKARLLALELHYNMNDKALIKLELHKKLNAELQRRDFLSDKKFSLMKQEITNALTSLNLS